MTIQRVVRCLKLRARGRVVRAAWGMSSVSGSFDSRDALAQDDGVFRDDGSVEGESKSRSFDSARLAFAQDDTFSNLVKRRVLRGLGAGTLMAWVFLVPALAWGQFQGNPPTQLSPQTPTLIPAGGAVASTFLLQSGDLFQIQVFNVPRFDFRGRLNEAGIVTLPLVGEVHLGGLSVSDAEHLIEHRLVEQEMLKAPQVVLTVLESPNNLATITGEVKTPGPVTVYGGKRLLDVISAAGGLTPAASPTVTIYRRGETTPIQVNLSADAAALGPANLPIQPGDSVIVSRVGVVYIVGAVKTQGAIPMKNTSPLTLIEALSLAGGVNYEAIHDKAYILRVQDEGRAEIRFDVTRVLQHRDPDLLLRNDDIILLPTSALKAALKGGAAGVAASLVAGLGYIVVR